MKKLSLSIILLCLVAIGAFYSSGDKRVVINEGKLQVVEKREPVTVLFVGDILLDRYARQVSDRNGEDFPFSCISDFLKGFDLVVGNLEGPITPYDSVSMGSEIGSPDNYVFTMPVRSARVLARHNVGLVNLGNNHIGNFGREGLASTKEYLSSEGVEFFGGLSGDEPIFETKGVSFVSYNEFGGQTPAEVNTRIAGEKSKGNTVVVFAHWGEEYSEPSPALREVATKFAESGADLIVGSHQHIALPREDIGNTPVYYSLGNFIFDQYWNEEVSTGLAVAVNFSDDGMRVEEYPVALGRDGRTCVEDSF